MNKTVQNVGLAILLVLIGWFAHGLFTPNNQSFSGTTADDWNVGGNLTVTGTSNITGATNLSSLTLSGAGIFSTFTQGGGITSTSTSAATATMLASEFDVENVYKMTPGGAALTLTSPASSSLSSFIPTAGQFRDILLENGSNVTSTVFAVGAGLNLYNATGTTATLTPGSNAFLRFIREGASATIGVYMISFAD